MGKPWVWGSKNWKRIVVDTAALPGKSRPDAPPAPDVPPAPELPPKPVLPPAPDAPPEPDVPPEADVPPEPDVPPEADVPPEPASACPAVESSPHPASATTMIPSPTSAARTMRRGYTSRTASPRAATLRLRHVVPRRANIQIRDLVGPGTVPSHCAWQHTVTGPVGVRLPLGLPAAALGTQASALAVAKCPLFTLA